jgi:hypothetical protein
MVAVMVVIAVGATGCLAGGPAIGAEGRPATDRVGTVAAPAADPVQGAPERVGRRPAAAPGSGGVVTVPVRSFPATERALKRQLREKRSSRWRRACRTQGNRVCWTRARHREVTQRMHRWMRRHLERRGASAATTDRRFVYCRSLPDCSCSAVGVDQRWFGLEWSITFDTDYTRRIPYLSAGEVLALPGLGAQFVDKLSAVTKGRLAVLALLGVAWSRVQSEASRAAAEGEQVRISAYTVWGQPFLPFIDIKTV